MYSGNEISPRNLQIWVDRLSVVFPEAPTQTRIGKITMMQNAS